MFDTWKAFDKRLNKKFDKKFDKIFFDRQHTSGRWLRYAQICFWEQKFFDTGTFCSCTVNIASLNMSFFEITLSTKFLISFCSREWHEFRDTTFDQIGPQVPSGLILENGGTFVIVFHFARPYIDHLKITLSTQNTNPLLTSKIITVCKTSVKNASQRD